MVETYEIVKKLTDKDRKERENYLSWIRASEIVARIINRDLK